MYGARDDQEEKVVCTSINIYINLDYIITNIYNYLQ